MHQRVGVHIFLSASLVAGIAHAEEPDKASTENCEAAYSVFNPMPDSCLDDIETDRPHKTDTPHTLEPGHARVEAALMEYEIERLKGPSDNSVALFNNEYTLGLANKVGFVRHWDVQVLHGIGSYSMRAKRFTMNDQLMLRSKVNVADGDIYVTLVPATMIPIRAGATAEAGGFVFLGGELPADVELEFNAGAMSETDPDAGNRHAMMVATAALTRHVAGPVTMFAELYNDTTSRQPRSWNTTFDSGLLVLLSKNWQVDAGAYVGVQGAVPALTPFVGLANRM